MTANYKLVDIKSIDTRKNSSAYDLFGYLYKKNGDPVTSYTTLATTDLLDHAQNVHGVDLRNSSKDKVKEYLSKSKFSEKSQLTLNLCVGFCLGNLPFNTVNNGGFQLIIYPYIRRTTDVARLL